MPARQYIGNHLLKLLPPTRCFGLKRRVLKLMGVNVSSTARIAKGLQVLGTLHLEIGEDAFVGHDVLICGGRSRVVIGSRVDIAPRVVLETGSHLIDMPGDRAAGQGVSRDIVIRNGAWLGVGVTVLGGVTIGESAVIAAGSVVTRDIPPRCVAAGSPCRVKKVWDPRTNDWTRAGHQEAA